MERALTDCVAVLRGGAEGVSAVGAAVLDGGGGEGLEGEAPEDAVGDVEGGHGGVEAGEEGAEQGGRDAVGTGEEGPVSRWGDRALVFQRSA